MLFAGGLLPVNYDESMLHLYWWIPSTTLGQRCSILQKSPNSNGTGFQRVPTENPLNANVAPVADPVFQPLLAVVGSTTIVENATGSLICLI